MTVLTATLTCPHCGHEKTETVPTSACLYFYECSACRTVLRPKPGDCCIFCSYGSSRCPPRQREGPWLRWRRRSIFGGAHETLTCQTRRHVAAERPDVAGRPAAVVWPGPTRNAGELRATNALPPVWAGRRRDDSRYPVRQFSVLRYHGARRRRAWWSRFRLRTRVPHCRFGGLDPRPGRSTSTAPSTSPSL